MALPKKVYVSRTPNGQLIVLETPDGFGVGIIVGVYELKTETKMQAVLVKDDTVIWGG